MGGIRALHDVIVVGMGPGGASAASMLRAPSTFDLAGEALDVLALEARSAIPTRGRVIAVNGFNAAESLRNADGFLGRTGAAETAPDQVASIAGVERTMREVAERVGVETRYDTRVQGVRDLGGAGIEVELADGVVERARFLVDASGGRLGPFVHGAPEGETLYLTGQLPPQADHGVQILGDGWTKIHGAGQDRTTGMVYGFNDAREGATVFVKYPSLPSGHDDARAARQLLRRHLRDAGISASGMRDAAFIRTPHVHIDSAVSGNMLAVGDSVRRLSPQTALGVANSIDDARMAARSIQAMLVEGETRAEALADYALAASLR